MKRFLALILFANIVSAEVVGLASNDGPNCINGALVHNRLVYGHRDNAQSELEVLIHSRLCRDD